MPRFAKQHCFSSSDDDDDDEIVSSDGEDNTPRVKRKRGALGKAAMGRFVDDEAGHSGSDSDDSIFGADGDIQLAGYRDDGWLAAEGSVSENNSDSDDSERANQVRRRLKTRPVQRERGDGNGDEEELDDQATGLPTTTHQRQATVDDTHAPDGTSGFYGGKKLFTWGPIGSVHYPIVWLSITVTRNGGHILPSWMLSIVAFLESCFEAYVANQEPGDREENLHAQICGQTTSPTDRAHLNKISALLRKKINPPSRQCKIKIVLMEGRHNAVDMIGYCYKFADRPGFQENRKNISDQMVEDARAPYMVHNRSFLTGRKSIGLTGWFKMVSGYYNIKIQPLNVPFPNVMLIMIKTKDFYCGDGFVRSSNHLSHERALILQKSIWRPATVTLHDVNFFFFNIKVKVEIEPQEGDQFSSNASYLPLEEPKYKFVYPSELDDGNPHSDIVWESDGRTYKIEQLFRAVTDERTQEAGLVVDVDQTGDGEDTQTDTQDTQNTETGGDNEGQTGDQVGYEISTST